VTFDYTHQETDGIAMLMRERADKSYTTGFMLFDRLPLDSDESLAWRDALSAPAILSSSVPVWPAAQQYHSLALQKFAQP
jgi:hypothetical protein